MHEGKGPCTAQCSNAGQVLGKQSSWCIVQGHSAWWNLTGRLTCDSWAQGWSRQCCPLRSQVHWGKSGKWPRAQGTSVTEPLQSWFFQGWPHLPSCSWHMGNIWGTTSCQKGTWPPCPTCLQAAEEDPIIHLAMGWGPAQSQIWPQACANSHKETFALWLGSNISLTCEIRTGGATTIFPGSPKTENQMRLMEHCLQTNWSPSPVAQHKCWESTLCPCWLQMEAQVP